MDETPRTLALVVGPCPECGNGKLDAVFDQELINFLCRNCGCCWHPELDWVQRVNPATCPGCSERAVCRAAERAYGESPSSGAVTRRANSPGPAVTNASGDEGR
jgi:hypothetical protein